MKKAAVIIFVLLLSAFIIACSGDDTTSTKTDAQIVADSIIDFPSCISSKDSTSKSVMRPEDSSDDAVTNIYEGIRENIGAIEEWTDVIEDLVADIFDLTEGSESGSWSNNNPAEGEPSKIEWGASDMAEYETMVKLYWLASDVDTLGFQAYITINAEEQTAKGEFIWDFSVANDTENPDNNAKLHIAFDGTADPKTLTIKAEGIDNQGDSDEPENAWLEASAGSDHIFKMSGNYYFEDIKIFDDAVSGEERNYVFTVIAYDEDYISGKPTNSNEGNKAILQLALPTSEFGNGHPDGWEATMWDDYSIGNIYCEKIKELWENDVDLDINDIDGYTEGELDLPASISELSSEKIIEILEWIALNKPDGNLSNLIFVLNLVNPAYFNSEGFLGTYDGERGTLDSKPTGFDGLNILSVQAIAPYDVKYLDISFL